MTTAEKIADIEVEMARTQKNKATEGHLALLKTKMAKLKRELMEPAKGQAGSGDGFDVKASGDARVGLIGFPSVGKSTLLTKLTGCSSEAADYEFTALESGQFSSEGTGFLLAQVVGSVSLLGKGISGLSSALFGDDGKDLGNVLAHGTHFGELNLGGRSDLAHTEGSEFFTVPLELLDTSGLVF